ncbi:hypothetical protein V7S43_006421 [Phytophthora oleae]|uniref:FERM domain-containing protein n=1 Tax=Phytophthora oleae TaxID=2107226 RepID=A0ABD3FTM8_9STRA
MEVSPTLDDAQALRQVTLADEHLMICLCGVDVENDADARVLQEAVQKIIRIKLQMGSSHQLSLARAQGSQLVVEQEFTRDVNALVAAVPRLLCSAGHDDVVLDSLLAHAARYFGAQREMDRQGPSSFRLLFVYRQVKQTPQLHISQSEVSLAFTNDPACHLDVIYWHQDVPLEAAQHVFDQLCEYDNTNPLAKFYFLEVGAAAERLHQVRFGSFFIVNS